MRNNLLFAPIAAAFLAVIAAACSDDTSNAPGCTPGAQSACACPQGAQGVQVCASDGQSFGECDCGGIADTCGNGNVDAGEECDDGNTTNDDACSNACTTPVCGDGIVQAGEDCDDAGATGEFDECPEDCQNGGAGGAGGGTGGGGTGGAGGGGGGTTCADVVMFAGVVTTAANLNPPGAWAGESAWSYDGLTGYDAGTAMCDAQFLGSHVCDYTELLAAEAKVDMLEPQLANLATGTMMWLNRTTDEMVMGMPSPAGAGIRCNDWTYITNHLYDGEFVEVAAPSDLTFNLDNTGATPQAGVLECGGVFRAIPCCNPCTP